MNWIGLFKNCSIRAIRNWIIEPPAIYKKSCHLNTNILTVLLTLLSAILLLIPTGITQKQKIHTVRLHYNNILISNNYLLPYEFAKPSTIVPADENLHRRTRIFWLLSRSHVIMYAWKMPDKVSYIINLKVLNTLDGKDESARMVYHWWLIRISCIISNSECNLELEDQVEP